MVKAQIKIFWGQVEPYVSFEKACMSCSLLHEIANNSLEVYEHKAIEQAANYTIPGDFQPVS